MDIRVKEVMYATGQIVYELYMEETHELSEFGVMSAPKWECVASFDSEKDLLYYVNKLRVESVKCWHWDLELDGDMDYVNGTKTELAHIDAEVPRKEIFECTFPQYSEGRGTLVTKLP